MNPRIAALIQTDIVFHRAAQFLALTGIALLEKKEDDSHTNLGWNTERKRLEGRWFEGQAGEFRLTFDPIDYELRWENRNRTTVDRFGLQKAEVKDIEAWWRQGCLAIGGKDVSRIGLHYDLPTSKEYKSSTFPELNAQSVIDWIQWRSRGERVISSLDRLFNSPIEPRIWPHHFDTGIFGPAGDSIISLGAGVAMADHMINEPYIYIYGWKGDSQLPISEVQSGIGEWKTGKWNGYVIPYSTFFGSKVSDMEKDLQSSADHILSS